MSVLIAGSTTKLILLGSTALAQQGPLNYYFRGDDGTCCSDPDSWGRYGDNGHDGHPGQRDFTVTDINKYVQSTQINAPAITVNVSGGHGGNGHDASDDHWGGNGGNSRNVDYTLQNSNIIGAGRGIDIYANGGNGGLYAHANGPNHGYGRGGNAGFASVALNRTTVVGHGYGVAVMSAGGNGSDSALVSWFGGEERDAGWGGSWGGVSVSLSRGTVVTVDGPGPDDISAGVGMLSLGGHGGTARHVGNFGGHSNAGNGGWASNVTFTSDKTSTITTFGDSVFGVSARALGGDASTSNGTDTAAGRGGKGGDINITNRGTITTHGAKSIGIFAQSKGGQGGNGGGGTWGSGHKGERGGDAGSINITNAGAISTGSAGTNGAYGIYAEALGGSGGAGGSAGAFGSGGNGGSGGSTGRAATINNSGRIMTLGNEGIGIAAHSTGGGGGRAGASNGIMYVGGGNGGNAGDGGDISLTNTGTITTTGDHSGAILFKSIGAGGGIGGDAYSTGVISSIAVGGRGGAAGNGHNVTASSSGKIQTSGANSEAVTLQSIGGGGGFGGSANAVGVGVGLNVTLALGGAGGAAGNGGAVSFSQDFRGSIVTAGEQSGGILAQSIGGGGGAGGFANSRAITIAPQIPDVPTGAVTIAVTHGGSGGAGGNGWNVDISNAGSISTAGAQSSGITAQSIGGGGGNGGGVLAPLQSPVIGNTNLNAQVSVRQGGQGGGGGNASLVQITNSRPGMISTTGSGSSGILAQSIGGGGGNGGVIQQHDEASFNAIVGSPQALPGLLDKVTEWLEKGPKLEFSKSINIAADITIGADGGGGGNGGKFNLTNEGGIRTTGDTAPAIVAQSIGGGGGNAGAIDATGTSSLLSSIDALISAATGSVTEAFSIAIPSFNVSVQKGGNGGWGGNGGGSDADPSTVINRGTVETHGTSSIGILAQSIGGGGGSSASKGQDISEVVKEAAGEGAASEAIIEKIEKVTKLLEFIATKSGSVIGSIAKIHSGGQNGAAGSGGAVVVDATSSTSRINTYGAQSPGIVVESIGGGGGSTALKQPLFYASKTSTEIIQGGSGALYFDSGANFGGSATVLHGGALSTTGTGSPAVVAHSIGGGGGIALISLSDSANVKTSKSVSLSVAQGAAYGINQSMRTGFHADAGVTTVTNTGQISTSGSLSPAILAQSIGGGGGLVIASSEVDVNSVDLTLGGRVPTANNNWDNLIANGNTVSVKNSGHISTNGSLSFGILAQSIGGGGGTILLSDGSNPLSKPMNATFGANKPMVGTGGTVNVVQDQNGILTTKGKNAHAIIAQSIGDGGGVAAMNLQPGLVTLKPIVSTLRADQYSSGGSINIDVGGAISTSGNGSIGVLAQSIGGGGGLAGDQSSASYGVDFIQQSDLQGATGAGGAVNVNVDTNAQIRTSGDNAPAILAMSVGGGGVFKDGNLYQFTYGLSGTISTGGDVTVTLKDNSTVAATGVKAPAIVAVSSGTERGGRVTVNIGRNANVSASLDSGVGVLALAPGNSISINNSGYIQAKTAIETLASSTVSNSGTVSGDVLMGMNSTFNNNVDGKLFTGARFNGILNNAGTLNPGGPNAFQATRIEGPLTNTGIYSPDLDFGNHNSDYISVSDGSTFGGTLTPVLHNPLKNEWLGIAHFDQNQTSIPTAKSSSPLFSYLLKNNFNASGWRDPLVAVEADFNTPAFALNADRRGIATHLQSLWEKAERKYAVLFNHFANVATNDQYNYALNTIAHDAQFARAAHQAHSSFASMNRLMSCPQFVGEGTILREGDCVWSRFDGNWTKRSATANDEDFRIRESTISIGMQREIATDWFLGASLGYGFGTTTAQGVSSDNNTYIGGVALKYNRAPWQISAAIHGGFETSDVSRWTPVGTAKSEVDSAFISGRIRAAYEFSMPTWYVRPYADFDLTHVHQRGYTEHGAMPFDLAVAGNSTTSFMVSPMVEFGSRTNYEAGTLRTYVGAGASFLTGGDVTTSLRLNDTDLAPFSLKSGMPRVYGNLSAGLELVTVNGFEIKAEYGLRAAKNYTNQTLAIRGAYRF